MTWIENIEVLTNANDHLSYTDRLISRGDVHPHMREQLIKELQMVRERVEDEDLYIAVVGRASTGKSTLINALLGDLLLESGILHMTTAVATFVRYGEEITVEIRFQDSGTIQAGKLWRNGRIDTSDTEILLENIELSQTRVWKVTPADEPITEPSLPGVKNLTIRQLIRNLTTTNEIARNIASITVTHPSEFLQSGLVIIDTPGADAQNQEHKEVTRRAVERADAAIIITPGEQSVSRWLLDVIEEPDFLQPFLHRCVFLVTRMDIAREQMRRNGRDEAITLIHQDAIQRLKSGLKKFDLAQDPRVYVSAAQSVVDRFSGEEPGVSDPEERVYWQDEFAKFQADLFGYIIHQRAVTIAESVLRLLDDLFESIEAHLSELWQDYESRRSRLKSIIQDIDGFGQEQEKLCREHLEKARRHGVNEIELAIDRERDKVLSDLRNAVYGASNVEGLQIVVTSKVKECLSKSENVIKKQIKKNTNKIKKEGQSFNTIFEKRFKELYEVLKLIGNAKYGSSSTKLTLSSADPGDSLQGNSALEDGTIGNLIGGAFVGAVIGSIFPVIGTITGAIIGGVIGSLFGPSLNERKDKVWNDLQPKIVEYFASLRSEASRIIEDFGYAVEENIQQRINNHVNQYRSDVDQMRQNQIREREELETLQSTLEKDLTDLTTRRNRVKTQQKRLRQTIEAQNNN